MTSRKLLYFDAIGWTEAIRFMLHYGGLEFEDERINVLDWPILELKDSLPFGQMPLYTENGRTLNQSMAIGRYVASQVPGLLPSDPWEQAQLDATAHNVYDLFRKVLPYLGETDPEKKAANKKYFYESAEYYLSRFEKELKANNGHFNGKLSWADFTFVGILKHLDFLLQETVEKGYPTIEALSNQIQNLPGVKEYLANKKPYVLNFLHVYENYRP